MNRFQKSQSNIPVGIIYPIISFLFIVAVFITGISSVERGSDSAEMENLTTVINRDLVHCYASKGVYPKNLEYLEKNYGLSYDKDRYEIEYNPLGDNVLPEVVVKRKFGR